MNAKIRNLFTAAMFFSAMGLFAQESEAAPVEAPASESVELSASAENSSESLPANESEVSDENDSVFLKNFTSLRGHRFLEARAAIPLFPFFTSHGVFQSFGAGMSDVFGTIFSFGNDYDHMTPKLATDLNVTIYPPFANFHCGFMAGAAIDTWNSDSNTYSMNFYYVGFHGEYCHLVFNDIGTRLSLYGEISVGAMEFDDEDSKDYHFAFDLCPFGIQFCPEKNIGIYFEIPHFGARPFFQTGISIGL
ncbi:hypothetical protein [uncultured Treponema sp.]|uniref:hypothetical protein n=1 Tax=uncultured Treponema sp. TaxID=162155 RepID=UPI0025F316AE|nr:hypothetical protein [uncultured Treponema sp.]